VARFCPNCGTEVDESAVFCPTCGQPIDQATELEMPPAPAWPEPPADRQTAQDPAPSAAAATSAPEPVDEEEPLEPAWQTVPRRPPPPAPMPPAPLEQAAGPAAPAEPPTAVTERPGAAVPPPPARTADPDRPSVDLPITMPLTLSAWLIGGGALLAALGALIGLFTGSLNPIELILLVALLGIAATVFLSSSVPSIPNLRLVTMVIVLIGFGIALDRLSIGAAGAGELLLFLGTAAAAMGAIILELGRDQPMGGAR
jgi:hypothetical protein